MRHARRVRGTHAIDTVPILATDLNGVLADANTPLLREVKTRYNLTLTPEELTSYDTLKNALKHHLPNPDQALRWLKQRVNAPDFILSLDPYPGVTELERWCQELELTLRIVTGHDAHSETVAATRRWLAINNIHAQCDFTRHKDGWVRQVQPTWLLEDAPHHAISCAGGTRVILIDRPYNRGTDLPRVPSLLDALALIRHDRVQ